MAQAQTKVVLQFKYLTYKIIINYLSKFSAIHRDEYDLIDTSKKDQFYLLITGLADIDFGNKDADECVKSLRPGHFNGIPTDMEMDDTLCVAEKYFVT